MKKKGAGGTEKELINPELPVSRQPYHNTFCTATDFMRLTAAQCCLGASKPLNEAVSASA